LGTHTTCFVQGVAGVTGTGDVVSIDTTTGQLITGGTTLQAGAIAVATVLTTNQSGTTFDITQGGAAFAITLPAVAPGLNYDFVIGTAGAMDVTIVTGDSYIGTIVNDVASVLPSTGTTLTLVGATTALGDNISIFGLGTVWRVKAISSVAGGITIA